MKVIFLFHVANNDLFAFFPADKSDNKGNFTSYSHVGQHSACSLEYAKEAEQAEFEQYKDLFTELHQQGYNDLQVVKKTALK